MLGYLKEKSRTEMMTKLTQNIIIHVHHTTQLHHTCITSSSVNIYSSYSPSSVSHYDVQYQLKIFMEQFAGKYRVYSNNVFIICLEKRMLPF